MAKGEKMSGCKCSYSWIDNLLIWIILFGLLFGFCEAKDSRLDVEIKKLRCEIEELQAEPGWYGICIERDQ